MTAKQLPRLLFLVCTPLVSGLAAAQEALPDWQTELTWEPPTENVDGSALDDLDGYWIYWGSASRDYEHAVYVDEEASTAYTFAPGTGPNFIAMTAVDADGNESAYSNEIVRSLAQAPVSLASAVLPTSRSVEVGVAATAFATVINDSAEAASDCRIGPALPFSGTFTYRETNAANEAIGPVNPALDIEPGGAATVVMSFAASETLAPTDVALNFSCANSAPAGILLGINTLTLSASATPVPDMITLTSTLSQDGVVSVPTDGASAFGVSTVNVGAAGTLTATVDTGSENLSAVLSLCETTEFGDCLESPSDSVTRFVDVTTSGTYSVFVQASGDIPFDPATNRVFVRFRDEQGVLRGSSSVAIRTQ